MQIKITFGVAAGTISADQIKCIYRAFNLPMDDLPKTPAEKLQPIWIEYATPQNAITVLRNILELDKNKLRIVKNEYGAKPRPQDDDKAPPEICIMHDHEG